MQPAERDARIGSVVDGRYKILDCMAAGSMGVVYRAERVPLGKAVAIKFLHAAFATESEFLTRFERETRVMSKLAHPHCVSVLDFGVFEGAPYLVMDFVAGTTLREILDDTGAIPVPRVLVLMKQILAGLAHAHDQGVVHRDIKPANLMISDEIGTGAHVRILDFGLARLRGALTANATQANVVVGTPSYMAPEQTVDAAVDSRADLYAAGVVMFEAITGDKPFWSDSTLELLAMHRNAPIPRLAELAPTVELPAGIQPVIDRALAKAPDDRYQTAMEFAEAIDDVIAHRVKPMGATPGAGAVRRGRTPRPEPSSPSTELIARRSKMWPIATLLLLVAAAAAAWYVDRRPDGAKAAAPAVAAEPVAAVDAGAVAAAVMPGAVADAAAVAVAEPVIADAAVAAVVAVADAGIADADADTNADDGSGGLDEAAVGDEAEPDPETALDPNPAAVAEGSEADEEEAADAPDDQAEVEVEVEVGPAPPAREPLARSTAEAVRMIKAGKRQLALASLRALRKKKPSSGYIPFLMGNLYVDKRWWSVGLEYYGAAIFQNRAYRRNGTLNRNVIRMLSSAKTRGKAERFLRRTIGRAARPYLRYAAKHDKNKTVRKRAAALAKSIR